MKHTTRSWASVLCSALLLSVGVPSSASAMPGEVSFTPTGLRLSIMRIVLSRTDANGNPTSQVALYTCEHAAEADCLVDVTDQAALDALADAAGDAAVNPGTYDTVSLEMCAAGKPGGDPAPGFVRGVFTVESEHKTYVTTAEEAFPLGLKELTVDTSTADASTSDAGGVDAGSLDASALDAGAVDSSPPDTSSVDAGSLDAGSADAGSVSTGAEGEFTAIGNWGCSTKSVHLPTPVEVVAGVATDLTVVMDKSLIAFSTPNVSGGMGGCRGQENGQARGICVSYPSIVPLVGGDAPTLNRYLIAHHRTDPELIDDSKANAYVVVVSSAEDNTPLTAFVRPYYSETSTQTSSGESYDSVFGGPAYFGETVTSSVHATPEGGIDFATGGSLDGNSAVFAGFIREDHKGVVQTRELGTWEYHAFPILP